MSRRDIHEWRRGSEASAFRGEQCYAHEVMRSDSIHREPCVDHRGVDRVQIRELLALAPLDRLRRISHELPIEDLGVVRVLDLKTLIEIKRRAGRPKDLAALPYLGATLDELES